MSTKISDQDQKWLDEINKLSEEGVSIAKRSSMESAEYVDLLLSNFDDKNYCQTVINQHIKENGHHYDNPMISVRSAHDNRELKDIVHLLILAGGNEIPSNHYGVLRDA